MKLWKLTNERGQTHGGCQWGEGVEHTASGEGNLCSEGWLHAYTDPLLAVLLNPIHASFDTATMQLWECEGDVGKDDHGLKVGCTRLRTLRRIDVPVVTTEQRVRFAILCSKEVCTDKTWNTWADGWLSGENRTKEATWAAAAVPGASAWEVAVAQETGWAARAVAEATGVAAEAAAAAARTAAEAWAREKQPLDLPAIARRALEEG